MALEGFKVTHQANNDIDTIRVDRRKGRVTGHLGIIKFQDKDTNQWVYFIPCFDLTTYGETQDKASEMLNYTLKEYFVYLVGMSVKKMEDELSKLGWKHDNVSNKKYSKAYVDVSGELKNFNADKIERLTVETA